MAGNPGGIKSAAWRAMLILAMMLVATVPAIAHQVEIHNDVGATIHLEPNDTPLAGAPSLVWFALTQRGGSIITLAECDCTLTVYDATHQVIATPALTPTTAEGFQNIPSATVTFPKVGNYELVLTGTPLANADFAPFELRYTVVVAGQAKGSANMSATDRPSQPSPASASTSTPETSAGKATSSFKRGWRWVGGLAIAALTSALGYWQLRSRQL